MLPIKLHTLETPNTQGLSEYAKKITHLASNTVAMYRGEELRPLGNEKPSFDISQVCCWVSGQPLANGMRLCTISDGNGKIKIISEPGDDEDGAIDEGSEESEEEDEDNDEVMEASNEEGEAGAMDEGSEEEEDDDENIGINLSNDKIFTSINQAETQDLLLISDDCCEGLKMSLEEFATKGGDQTLIKDPNNPDENVSNPYKRSHYVWPNQIIYWKTPDVVVLNNINRTDNESADGKLGFKSYTSADCFIYTKKTALVQQMVDETEEGNADYDALTEASATLEEFLFVEANPALPEPLYIMAQNTIRLFRLNSRHYRHTGEDFHRIAYNTSKSETPYDDLRLTGRMEAYKQARKSLDQLKNIRNSGLDQGTIEVFNSQYKILMELSGYRSVWATVFNEGGDPGGFNDILGGIPAPTTPVPDDVSVESDREITVTRNPVNILSVDEIVKIINDYMPEDSGGVDEGNLIENSKRAAADGNLWKNAGRNTKSKRLKKENEPLVLKSLIKGRKRLLSESEKNKAAESTKRKCTLFANITNVR